MMEEKVWIACGALKLEARFWRGGAGAALICHPHPVYGGNMGNNVVIAASSTFQRMGWATLRFNFRGVGRSQGESGEGENEVDDVHAAMRFLREDQNVPPGRTLLVGYSFGAWVGLRALTQSAPLLGWVAIAPPVGVWDFGFAQALGGRKFVVAGDRDTFCPPGPFKALVDALPEPKEWAVLRDSDHFFWGREEDVSHVLEGAVRAWTEMDLTAEG